VCRRAIRTLVSGGVVAALLAASAAAAPGPNLAVNGSFDSGTSGFKSSYVIATSLGSPGTIAVGTNSQALNPNWPPYHDHTSGSGPMLLVNGSTTAGETVWPEQVAVAPAMAYTFSGWEMRLYQPPAELRFLVNGKVVGQLTTPVVGGLWTRFAFSSSSGSATNATLEILDESTRSAATTSRSTTSRSRAAAQG